MNLKKIVSLVLGAFVIVVIGVIVYNSVKDKEKVMKDEPIVSSKTWVDATYFLTTVRCHTCKQMERYIKESLNESFEKELGEETLKFHATNVDLPENDHYVQDYKLHTKSFILSLKRNGKEEAWLNCEKIWKLSRDEEMFKKYIKIEVKKYLEMI